MMRLKTLAIVCLVGAAALPGCGPKALSSKVGTPLEHREKVIAHGLTLQDALRVTALEADRIEGDLLRVRLGLENVKSGDLWADIQVIFYDADHFELEKTNWQPLLMAGKQVTYYQTTSLSAQAMDYTIMLRNPRKSVAR